MLPLGKRRSDAVIEVCQDNQACDVLIRETNPICEEAIGHAMEALKDTPLITLLPPYLRDMLAEQLVYDDEGPDLAEVLARIRHFSLKAKDGREVPFLLRVHRSGMEGANPRFLLVLRDMTLEREREEARMALKENFKGHEVLDVTTGLPNRDSLIKDVELVCYHVASKGLKACFAIAQPDDWESWQRQYSSAHLNALAQEIGARIRQVLREEDMVGALGRGRYGMLLMDTDAEGAKIALNRLRWSFGNHPIEAEGMKPLTVHLSIGFMPILPISTPSGLIADAEGLLTTALQGGGNKVEG